MDFAKIIARIRGILTTPRTEWPTIAAEPDSVQGLYTGYILIVAALPVLARFIKDSLIGVSVLGTPFRLPIGVGIATMLLGYLMSLALTYIIAWVINALAPTFEGQKNFVQALKATAYAWTASWVISIAVILPWLGGIIAIAGAIYAIYLLYLGLPHTMKCPAHRAGAYTAVSIIIGVVLTIAVGILIAHLTGVSGIVRDTFGGHGMHARYSSNPDGSIDTQTPLGRLTAATQAASADGHIKVESLSADQIKSFLPDSLSGFTRHNLSAERNGMGMQASSATADYTDNSGHDISLALVDTGNMRSLMAMAGAMAPESDQETDHGYNKTYTKDGRFIHEQWDSASKNGEYTEIVGQRFTVKASGHVDSIDQLKQAIDAVDLSKLEALKDQGVSAN
jgi:hypothetical protein